MLVSVSYSEDAMCTWDLETGRILRIIHVSGVNDVVGSHHHSLVFPIANGGRSPVVCDAERSSWCGLEGRVCAAAFMPEGRSLITGIMSKQKEGLDTWDLSPLLERRESGTYSPFENATDVSKLVDMSFGGPQVSTPSPAKYSYLIILLLLTEVNGHVFGRVSRQFARCIGVRNQRRLDALEHPF